MDPRGSARLYVRRREPRVRLEPQIDGGGHEHGLRSGTLATPNIVGLGKACELAQQEMAAEVPRRLQLRERLRHGLTDVLDDVALNGHLTRRLPGNLNLSFAYVKAEALLVALKNIAVSTGSACTSAELRPSHVLKALGLSDDLADGSLHFGIGRFNTQEEIDWVVPHVIEAVRRLRLNLVWQMERAPAS